MDKKLTNLEETEGSKTILSALLRGDADSETGQKLSRLDILTNSNVLVYNLQLCETNYTGRLDQIQRHRR